VACAAAYLSRGGRGNSLEVSFVSFQRFLLSKNGSDKNEKRPCGMTSFLGPSVQATSTIAPETPLGKADRQVCNPVTSAAVPLDWPFLPRFQQLILMN
jgi:hypothetical protein